MVSTATEAVLLDNAAFSRLVTEEHLQTTELGGYVYTGKQGKDGWVVFRTYGPKWRNLYICRQTAKQTNAGGGAILVDLTCASGMMFELVSMQAVNSGTNTLVCRIYDSANDTHLNNISSMGSAAGTNFNLPSVGGTAATSSNTPLSLGLKVGPGQKLTALQTGVGLQNDELMVAVSLLLPITATAADISWSKARSTNAADVTLTENLAASVTPVLIP